jgi:hypothetical protein
MTPLIANRGRIVCWVIRILRAFAPLREAIAAFGSGPSVTASPRHLPQTSWGRILEPSLSAKILPELVSGRGTAAAGGGGGALDA